MRTARTTPVAWERLPDGTVVITMPFDDGRPGWVGAEIFGENAAATAAYIVTAANAYPKLVAALRAIEKSAWVKDNGTQSTGELSSRLYDIGYAARAALQAAQEGAR